MEEFPSFDLVDRRLDLEGKKGRNPFVVAIDPPRRTKHERYKMPSNPQVLLTAAHMQKKLNSPYKILFGPTGHGIESGLEILIGSGLSPTGEMGNRIDRGHR